MYLKVQDHISTIFYTAQTQFLAFSSECIDFNSIPFDSILFEIQNIVRIEYKMHLCRVQKYS